MKTFKEIIQYIFFPQWQLVRTYTADWTLTNTETKEQHDRSAIYIVMVSEIRGVYKVKYRGYYAKEHPAFYNSIVPVLIEMTSKQRGNIKYRLVI